VGRKRKRDLSPEEERDAIRKLVSESPGIELRGDAIRIDFMHKGKRCRETLKVPLTFSNVEYAINKRRSIQLEIRQGVFDYAVHFPQSTKARSTKASRTITVAQLLDRYLVVKVANITSETEIRYRNALDACCSTVGWSIPVNTLMPEDIDRMRADLIATRRPSTVNHYLATWNGMVEWARANEYATRNLQALFFKNVVEDPDPLTLDEFRQVIEKGCLHAQDRALVTLAVYTGLRPGELCALAREDVRGNCLHVRRSITSHDVLKVTKTGTDRKIWLVPPALEAIKALLQMTENEKAREELVEISRHQSKTEIITPLVTPVQARNKSITNRRIQVSSWATKWKKLLSRAGVRRRVAYQSRHTYACWSLTAHGNIAFIAKQMGHKDYSMLVKVYARWMDSESESEADFIWQELQKNGAFCPTIAPND
jgi:integrase